MVFAGDSILRLLFAALLRLLTTDGSEQVLFGHRVRVAMPPALSPPFPPSPIQSSQPTHVTEATEAPGELAECTRRIRADEGKKGARTKG